MHPTKNNGIVMKYQLENGDEASEFFSPFAEHAVPKRIWKSVFVKKHVPKERVAEFNRLRTAYEICNSGIAMLPIKITHRLNDQGKSIINRRMF